MNRAQLTQYALLYGRSDRRAAHHAAGLSSASDTAHFVIGTVALALGVIALALLPLVFF